MVRTELGFARDLLYTKYPILFSSGFPVVSTALFVVTVGVSVWITVSAVRHYRVPHGSSSNLVHGKNVDLLITFVIVGHGYPGMKASSSSTSSPTGLRYARGVTTYQSESLTYKFFSFSVDVIG